MNISKTAAEALGAVPPVTYKPSDNSQQQPADTATVVSYGSGHAAVADISLRAYAAADAGEYAPTLPPEAPSSPVPAAPSPRLAQALSAYSGTDRATAAVTPGRLAAGSEGVLDVTRYGRTNADDPAAVALADRLGGIPSATIPGFPGREFDAVSRDYVAQTTGAVSAVTKPHNYMDQGRREQMRVTMQAARQESKTALFEFTAGTPHPDVASTLQRYASRYNADYRISDPSHPAPGA